MQTRNKDLFSTQSYGLGYNGISQFPYTPTGICHVLENLDSLTTEKQIAKQIDVNFFFVSMVLSKPN